ncbi:MAG: hypothetical protein DLM58_18025 [Pseudonocardiales bacterium]|nr:MAG: hypothetical protein DLM58_18025 [Pseudonocardiales bacterium]
MPRGDHEQQDDGDDSTGDAGGSAPFAVPTPVRRSFGGMVAGVVLGHAEVRIFALRSGHRVVHLLGGLFGLLASGIGYSDSTT